MAFQTGKHLGGFKMKIARIFVLIISLVLIGSAGVFALSDTASHDVTMQVNEIALIDLNDATVIVLSTNAPANGGETVLGATDATKKLQYTSLVTSGTTRTITANWGGADVAPAGTSLKLEATSVPAGAGTADAQITLSAVAQPIVSAIGSVATGTGANGTELTYTFSIDNVALLDVGDNQTVTITFTLTAEA